MKCLNCTKEFTQSHAEHYFCNAFCFEEWARKFSDSYIPKREIFAAIKAAREQLQQIYTKLR